MISGIDQGWDLHPAQLVPRYAAAFTFFHEALPAVAARLQRFWQAQERATVSGGIFDDAASGRGLTNFFARGLSCGALSQADLLAVGFTPAQGRAMAPAIALE